MTQSGFITHSSQALIQGLFNPSQIRARNERLDFAAKHEMLAAKQERLL